MLKMIKRFIEHYKNTAIIKKDGVNTGSSDEKCRTKCKVLPLRFNNSGGINDGDSGNRPDMKVPPFNCKYR